MRKATGHGYGVLTKTPELVCEEIENLVRELHGLEAQHVAVASETAGEPMEIRPETETEE